MPQRPRKRSSPPLRSQDAGQSPGDAIRLQKVLAAAGAGSRRQCEELILTGRVEVDRKVVTELGVRVDPGQQEVRLDGVPIRHPRRVYYAVNKPEGVLSTNRDPSGRPRVVDLVPKCHERLFTVGRLDLHSDGLILVTNDGDLANRLTHPRYGVEKTYRVQVAGEPGPEVLSKLTRGVWTAEGVMKARQVKVRGTHKASTVLEIVLDEGRNREIRRMLARVGHKVLKLTRLAVGPVRLADLAPGACRRLAAAEVESLRKAARGARRQGQGGGPKVETRRGRGKPRRGKPDRRRGK